VRRFGVIALAGCVFSGCVFSGLVVADDMQQRADASRAAIKEFRAAFMAELQKAMQAGGPPAAIEVCHAKAPAIAAGISKRTGWRVARTSLKVRNPANAPDAWEKKVLESFEQRKANGEPLDRMEFYEIVRQDGARQFRYMKAIPVGGPCMACHGSRIDPAVAAKLRQWYPQDQATGFRPGDLRGAFTITQPM
jgi:uncharacterized protein DUF3365